MSPSTRRRPSMLAPRTPGSSNNHRKRTKMPPAGRRSSTPPARYTVGLELGGTVHLTTHPLCISHKAMYMAVQGAGCRQIQNQTHLLHPISQTDGTMYLRREYISDVAMERFSNSRIFVVVG